jgi:[glutamine synthetase] adenylyltransferase / [glutamine synthetase]-adenylyl-L-tyrosine phosphorylase
MQHFGFVSEARNLPLAGNFDRAALGLERWRAAIDDDGPLAAFADGFAADANGRRMLDAIFGNSPFLTQCAATDPGFARELLTRGPDGAFAGVMEELEATRRQPMDDDHLARLLRVARRRVALSVAVADIASAWPLEKITGALSDFAEAALGCCAAHLLRAAAANGAFTLIDADDPERGSGLVILGMGKLGARELNYSSDIDLIVLYDHEIIHCERPDDLQNQFVRLTRNLIRLMDARTVDGYVLRTDLRLRPDPGATPLAVSVLAAETYYESLGQNWERAAMIKARPVAGDRQAGAEFLDRLRPYIWRKNLDFAAIQDIHSIKRQINAHRGGSEIAVYGHDVKLGRGGIREIEFFAQTQQLIWGGREPALRQSNTVEALRALAAAGRVAETTAEDLIASYRYLRRVEHRLQMIDDEQTHTLPRDPGKVRELAVFLGYADADSFADDLLFHLRHVETHYAQLFEDAPSLSAPGAVTGNLVFTGGDPDPETMRTIERMGFDNPKAVDDAVRGWHHGRYRAIRTSRARELLTELTPALLTILAATPVPDDAFIRFDRFVSRLPAGVQLFAMFHSNRHLLALVAEIIGNAPRLAEHLSSRPSVLDSVLTADFFDSPPSPEELDEELDRLLARTTGFEDVLDVGRRWANDRKFQVGVQSLRGHLPAPAAAEALSNIADTALGRLLPRVENEFALKHGRFAGTGMAIVAMGKLGGRETTPASDLDLLFVYTTPEGAEASDGQRPLSPAQYFARLSQRLINAVAAHTNEGRLYEVDMRLRPSGNAGPLASSFEGFAQYHDEAAWTWEHMALTRARVIAGPPELCGRVEAVIADVLTRPRDADKLLADVAAMRARMDAEHHTEFIWEVKHLRGGLVDVEFIAQYLQLRHAHARPDIIATNTRTAFERLHRAGFLDDATTRELIEALDLWQGIQAMLRLTIEGRFRLDGVTDIPEGLREALAKVGGVADLATLENKMRTVAATVHGYFADLIGTPAKALSDTKEKAP